MKTKRFKSNNLRNNAWFQFFTDFKNLVEHYTPKTLNIEQLFEVFISYYNDADEAMMLITKSSFTEELNKADMDRDTSFRGFTDAIKSFLKHFDDSKRDAAKRIQIVLDTYGNILRIPFNEETSAIYNLVQEMRGNYADNITLLGLTDWVNRLDLDNKKYENLSRKRNSEAAEQTELRMKNIRIEATRNYLDILDRIDALILINGEELYESFVREQSVLVNRYK